MIVTNQPACRAFKNIPGAKNQSPPRHAAGGDPGVNDALQTSAQFAREVGRVTGWGALAGGTVAGALAAMMRGTAWPVGMAFTLSGALVGACVAEEQLRFRLGEPVEIPPAYR